MYTQTHFMCIYVNIQYVWLARNGLEKVSFVSKRIVTITNYLHLTSNIKILPDS